MGATCSSCNAPIIWVVTGKGARMPVDAKSEKRLVLETAGSLPLDPVARVVDTYVSHFATCPNSAQHRKPRSST